MSSKIQGTTVTLSAGERLSFRNTELNEIYVVLKGKIKCMTSYGNYILAPGSCVGFIDFFYGICIYNYFVEEDATLKKYVVSSSNDIVEVLKDQAGNIGIEIIMQSRFANELCNTYNDLLSRSQKKNAGYTPDVKINSWELDKYISLQSIPNNLSLEYYKANLSVAIGLFYDGLRFISSINDACTQMADLLEINLDFVEETEEYIIAIDETAVPLECNTDDDTEYILTHTDKSLAKILSFAEYDEEEAAAFTQMIIEYRNPKVQSSISDDARQLRRDIAKNYYKLYEAVFFKAINTVNVPVLILMFLNFGYLDENLLEQSQVIELYKVASTVDALYSGNNVYTIYTWLREIYWGDKEPSRNTMDMDYAEYITAEHKMGRISSSEMNEALTQNGNKVHYEIENLFQSANRVAYGRSATYCPILTKNNITRSIQSLVMTGDKTKAAIDYIRKIDFSAFYREILYVNKAAGIEKEFIACEVLPNIILMPTTGNDGTMWQDIEGRVRNTPARFTMPILPSINPTVIITQLVGKFRWELCKRMQGSRWNMISEPSLTSEYCDYIQFYKKNRELSEAAKEKLKNSLAACRNNYRDVFAKDYETWILYETTGSFKLNKVSRRILFKYCPFVKELRNHLAENPLMAELLSKPNKDTAVKLRHIETVISNLTKKGVDIPNEIMEYKAFLSK